MKRVLTLIPSVSIYPDKIILLNRAHWEPGRPARHQYITGITDNEVVYEHLLESARKANGYLSEIAIRKISRAIEYLLYLASPKKVTERLSGKIINFKVAFVTLSLSSEQVHEDKEIRRELLNQFFVEVKKKYKVKNYVWKAEKQKNGNIHFHILVDKFIHYSELRDLWNRIQNKLGYVERYRDKQKEWHKEGFRLRQELTGKWSADAQYKAWLKEKKTDYHNPNSTDIHSLKNIKNTKAYIMKYMEKEPEVNEKMTKEEKEKLLVEGRLWGCNQELSSVRGAMTDIDNQISDEILKVTTDKKIYKVHDTYFDIFFISIQELMKRGLLHLYELFRAYCREHFHLPENYKFAF